MNKFLKTQFILLLVIALASCNSDKRFFVDSETFSVQDLEIIMLKSEIVQLNDTIWKPVSINIKDSLLFIKNHLTNYIYDIYNLNNNKKINECLKIGQGPDEFIYPRIVPSMDSNVWIFDSEITVLKEYSVLDLVCNNYNTLFSKK